MESRLLERSHRPTRSLSGVEEPGQHYDKWITGKRRSWSSNDNLGLMECCYSSKASQKE